MELSDLMSARNISNISQVACGNQCADYVVCESFSYDLATKMCRLYFIESTNQAFEINKRNATSNVEFWERFNY